MPPDIIKEIKEQPGFMLRVELPEGNDGCLRLVHVDRKDAAVLAKWRTDHYEKFFTRIKPNENEVLDWLKRYQSDGADLMFLVEYPHDRPIGQMALSKIDLHKKSAEFGRIIHGRKGAPKGIMHIAAQTLIAWAFRSFHLHQIYLQLFADNHPAVHMYGKLGFHVAEIHYYQRTITATGVEQYMKIEQERTGGDDRSARVVYRMILKGG